MILRLFRRQPLLMIVPQQLVQEIDRFVGDVSLIFRRDEFAPWFAWVSAEDVVVLLVEFNIVAFEARQRRTSARCAKSTKRSSSLDEQLVRSQHLGDFYQLVVVVMAVKEAAKRGQKRVSSHSSSRKNCETSYGSFRKIWKNHRDQCCARASSSAFQLTILAYMHPKLHMSKL